MSRRRTPYSAAVAQDSIRFLLNGAPVAAAGVSPHLSLLEWLREHAGLTGTKEGCAEGDCGACTVLLAEPEGAQGVRVAPVNACIRLLPSVDGKAVFTVEGLGAPERLHPVQQALADGHASQCGFCTPGFVMSLTALYKTRAAPSREEVVESLAGNLCRCTGYRPIVEAALGVAQGACTGAAGGVIDAWLRAPAGADDTVAAAGATALRAALDGLARTSDLHYEAGGESWHAPRSVAALSRLVREHPEAWMVAGATDVGLWINKQLRRAPVLIHTAAVAGLADIETRDGVLDIGAAATLDRAFAALDPHYPEFTPLWRRFASPPVRASGTLGGNVANGSPIGDSMPVLIALGAKVRLRHGDAVRDLPLEDLYVGYKRQARVAGEWVERILVPLRRPGQRVAAYKLSKRNEQDISAVCLAIAVELEGDRLRAARIAVGGMAAIPARAREAEGALLVHGLSEAGVRAAMDSLASGFTPLSDMRAGAAYRMKAAQNLLWRFWLETSRPGIETRVFG